MPTRNTDTNELFPISAERLQGTLEMVGRFNDETLPLMERIHLRRALPNSPLRYLHDTLPLRPYLRSADRTLNRMEYSAGLWVGAVVMRNVIRTAEHPVPSLVIPDDPEHDGRLRQLRARAVGRRFRLQSLFRSEQDMLTVLRRTVEFPWFEHNIRFGVNKGRDTAGKPRDDLVIVALGDMLALCNELTGDPIEVETVPLVDEDAIRSADTGA